MQRFESIQDAREKVLADVTACLDRIRAACDTPFVDADSAVDVLQMVRSETYEDLNQIQHEHLIVRAVEWLLGEGICPPETKWGWNPRQTGDHTEPDLIGIVGGEILVSAEITTSAKPSGVIDTRMGKTLSKLSNQMGQLFYFVRTEPMRTRASTKVRRGGWSIRVVKIEAPRGT